MTTRANEPAFPDLTRIESDGNDFTALCRGGLTIREHFAGLAMQGLLACMNTDTAPSTTIATWAVDHADALLAELAKEQK